MLLEHYNISGKTVAKAFGCWNILRGSRISRRVRHRCASIRCEIEARNRSCLAKAETAKHEHINDLSKHLLLAQAEIAEQAEVLHVATMTHDTSRVILLGDPTLLIQELHVCWEWLTHRTLERIDYLFQGRQRQRFATRCMQT